MRHEDIKFGSPEDWLRHAQSDLALARIGISSNILAETLCFHAQQAAEKALKSVLIYKNIEFPKTHNIKILIELLPDDISTAKEILESSILTDYSVTSRYPGNFEEITIDEYTKAVQLAAHVVDWADTIIK
jgi:HEPN domain-containing protein